MTSLKPDGTNCGSNCVTCLGTGYVALTQATSLIPCLDCGGSGTGEAFEEHQDFWARLDK